MSSYMGIAYNNGFVDNIITDNEKLYLKAI